MNKASRVAAEIKLEANPLQLRASYFHSTTLLERRRRTHWDSASSYRSSPKYSKRISKQSLLHNVSQFAEHLFQSDKDEYDQPSSGRSSWFRPNFRDDDFNKRGRSRNTRSQASRRDFEFCDIEDDDVEFETIFGKAFGGGNRHSYWSFTSDDDPRFKKYNHRNSSNWRNHFNEEYDYDSSSEYEKTVTNLTSERLALGLSSSGPLNLKDVKNAYRACALKWHPDRHQGSSKVFLYGGVYVIISYHRGCLCNNIIPQGVSIL
ncbi:hypothetical protein ACJIZ3_005816 [Penstemon smallii]|uniref:J domain-containing protein n=1 Tax=Penstemon smallii TaxID=265156 RepID=A0ABD3S644_9LAMI